MQQKCCINDNQVSVSDTDSKLGDSRTRKDAII